MLVGMLNRHPQIKCLGELMRPTPEYMLRTGYRDVLTVLEKSIQNLKMMTIDCPMRNLSARYFHFS